MVKQPVVITGAIHTPTMSDALPYTPDDIAPQAITVAEAGASMPQKSPVSRIVSTTRSPSIPVLPSWA
jgi:hypothetical protein